jgi:hypothetical protein
VGDEGEKAAVERGRGVALLGRVFLNLLPGVMGGFPFKSRVSRVKRRVQNRRSRVQIRGMGSFSMRGEFSAICADDGLAASLSGVCVCVRRKSIHTFGTVCKPDPCGRGGDSPLERR